MSNNKWINEEIIAAKWKLQFLYKLYKDTKTIDNIQLYTSYKRKYYTIIKTVKANFISNTTANSSNISKLVWKIVNEERCNGQKYCHKYLITV
jgi:hypothetical protein